MIKLFNKLSLEGYLFALFFKKKNLTFGRKNKTCNFGWSLIALMKAAHIVVHDDSSTHVSYTTGTRDIVVYSGARR